MKGETKSICLYLILLFKVRVKNVCSAQIASKFLPMGACPIFQPVRRILNASLIANN